MNGNPWPDKFILRVGNVSHIVRPSPNPARLDAFKKKARRPKVKKKVPNNSVRRVKSPQPPRAVEHFFTVVCKRVTKGVMNALKAIVLPLVKDFARPETERTDAKGDPAKAVGKQLRAAAKRSFNEKEFISGVDRASERTEKHSKNEFTRLGIDIKKEPEMKWLVDGWRRDNVERITKMHDHEIDKVETILREGFGRSRESISKDILNQLDGVSQSRAELIARDQILTLHAQINRSRQEAAGIDSYVWTTSGDERVRPEHEDLDGEEFTWESGGDPEEGHPGEPVQCRCTSFPILPEIEDEASEEDTTDEDEEQQDDESEGDA